MPVTISGTTGISIDGTAVATVDNLSGPFNAVATITATDASWSVPTLADPVVRVTVIGGGGGGSSGSNGGTGGTSSFVAGGTTVTATGGNRGNRTSQNGLAPTVGFASGNGGQSACSNAGSHHSNNGLNGSIVVQYVDMTGISTANVTVGAGGTAGGPWGGSGVTPSFAAAGGRGEVIVEYRAG